MKLSLSEIIEQFEDAFILQPMNELEIYRKWIPKLRQAYGALATDDDCAGCEHASDKRTYDCMAPSLTPCPPEQTKKGDY